jgi:hypothetical protein
MRAISAETTELVSRAFAAPSDSPNGESCRARISPTDARSCSACGPQPDLEPRHAEPRLFARSDRRDRGHRAAVARSGPCGCCRTRFSATVTPEAPTAASSHLEWSFFSAREPAVPPGPGHSRTGSRAAPPLSVDPTGYPISAYPCGGSSSTALSADGRVLVRRRRYGPGLADANGGARRAPSRPRHGGHAGSNRSAPVRQASNCEPQRSRLRIHRTHPRLGATASRQWTARVKARPGFRRPDGGQPSACVYAGEKSTQIDAEYRPTRAGDASRMAGGEGTETRSSSSRPPGSPVRARRW